MAKESGREASPLHHEFVSCALALKLSRREPFEGEELKAMARELVLAVAEKTRIAGAAEIGHVKAVLECGEGIIYANTVGDPSDVTAKGEAKNLSAEISLTLNSVAIGLSGRAAEEAAREAAEVWAEIYGLGMKA